MSSPPSDGYLISIGRALQATLFKASKHAAKREPRPPLVALEMPFVHPETPYQLLMGIQ